MEHRPSVLQVGHGDYRHARPHDLAFFHHLQGDLARDGALDFCFFQIGVHLGVGAFGLLHQGFCSLLVFVAGACQGHLVLGPSRIGSPLGGLHLGFGLVPLLQREHAFVIEFLHPLVGVLRQVGGILCTGRHGLQGLYVFGAGAVFCLVGLGLGRPQRSLGLHFLGLDFGAVDDRHQGVFLDGLTFTDQKFFYASGDFPCHQHAAGFHLPLQVLVLRLCRKFLKLQNSRHHKGHQHDNRKNLACKLYLVHYSFPTVLLFNMTPACSTSPLASSRPSQAMTAS